MDKPVTKKPQRYTATRVAESVKLYIIWMVVFGALAGMMLVDMFTD
jgi:hypothetical protein